ncbi:MAG: radical SAM protein [Candidatus Micrarchaeia archaeon]
MALKELFSIAGTGIKSNFVTLKKPYKLNFAITYWCNSRCLTCNIWQMKPKGELTIDEVREFARRNNYFKWIEITGGEPFMRSDIVEIVKAFKEHSKNLYIVTIPTNSLTNHDSVIEKTKAMLELKIPKLAITVSLDGYRELHDKIRGVPGNYDKAIDMYKRLAELKKTYKNLYFVFGYTLSNLNEGQFQKTYEAVKSDIPGITYNDFHINLAQISDNYYGNGNLSIKPSGAGIANEIAYVVRKRQRRLNAIEMIEHAFLKGLAVYARTGRMPLHSRSLEASVFMDSFGNIYPSIMWNQRIGNIRDSAYELSPLLENTVAQAVRQAVKEGREPVQWTSCEAYQAITGSIPSMFIMKPGQK